MQTDEDQPRELDSSRQKIYKRIAAYMLLVVTVLMGLVIWDAVNVHSSTKMHMPFIVMLAMSAFALAYCLFSRWRFDPLDQSHYHEAGLWLFLGITILVITVLVFTQYNFVQLVY